MAAATKNNKKTVGVIKHLSVKGLRVDFSKVPAKMSSKITTVNCPYKMTQAEIFDCKLFIAHLQVIPDRLYCKYVNNILIYNN